MSKKIKKAIITAAGYGTRFLPAVKNVPKEMLPIIEKPIIHYLVEEAVDSGIVDIIIVTRTGCGAIEDYFDHRRELENALEKTGKDEYLKIIKDIPNMATFTYIRQKDKLPYGNGSPLLACQHLIEKGETVAFMFGDDLTISKTPVLKQLIDVYEKEDPDAILAVQEVPWNEIDRYGSAKYKEKANYKYEVDEILEKLPKEEAPSNMAQFGRFILSYEVVKEAKQSKTGKDNELWLTDILNSLAKKGKVIAQPIEGEWLTTGDPLRYIKAVLKFSMLRDDMKEDLVSFIKQEII